MMKIFLDTETTGLKPNDGDRIVEIAAIAYQERTPVEAKDGGEYHQYINPQRTMPAEAQQIHGLGDDFLADKPLFAEVADAFIEFIRGHELIIHNAAFDRGFLNAEFARLNKPPLEEIAAEITCSLEWSRKNNQQVNSHSLNALCKHYQINLTARADYHSAIVDTRLLGEVYFRMRQQQIEMNMSTAPIAIEARGGAVTVQYARTEELAAHDAILSEMEKEHPPLYQKYPTN